MTLSRDRARRTPGNRPRRPTSVLAGLALVAMGLLFVGLIGVSGATWLVTELSSHVRPQFQQGGGQVGGGQVGGGQGGVVQGGGGVPLGNRAGPYLNPGPPGPKFDDNLAIKITLTKGAFHGRTLLAANDPQDRVQRTVQDPNNGAMKQVGALPCKVFLVELQAGKRYTIEYKRVPPTSNAFDPYLRIESLDGRRLIEFDDIVQGQDLDARIEPRDWTPPQTGTYRIYCTLWDHRPQDGQPLRWDFTFSIREEGVQLPPVQTILFNNLTPPAPIAGNQQLPSNRSDDKDITVHTPLGFAGDAPVRGDLCWSQDGTAFFALTANDTVRRVAVDGFTVQRRLELGRPAGRLAISALGPVVSIPSLGEVWLLDPVSLDVKQRFATLSWAPDQAIAAAPGLDYIYVAAPPQNPPAGPPFANQPGVQPPQFQQKLPPFKQPKGQPKPIDLNLRRGVVRIDLKTGGFLQFVDIPNNGLAVTPDGACLFAIEDNANWPKNLVRFRVKDGGDLQREEVGPALAKADNARINISADGRFVCPTAAGVPSAIYPVGNLRNPTATLNTAGNVRAVEFDARGERIFTGTNASLLMIFSNDGKEQSKSVLPGSGVRQEPLQFAMQPKGNRLLIRFQSKVCLVELPNIANNVVADRFPAFVPIKDGEPLVAAAVKSAGDLKYRELRLPNLGDIDPCWNADGGYLFHVDTEWTLHRIKLRDYTSDLQLPIGKPVAAIALSKDGLLIALRDEPQIWRINPETFKVTAAIGDFQAKYLAAHSKSSSVIAVGTEVARLDFDAGKARRGLQPHADAGLPFQHPAITPDGKYLFLSHASGGASKVLRVRIEADKLIVEESKPTTVKAGHTFCVSPDGKHVAWFSPYIGDKKQETAFYAVGDWKAPAYTLPERARTAEFTHDGSLVYVYTHDNQMCRFTDGKEETRLPWKEGRIRDIAPHPRQAETFLVSAGGRVFVATRDVK